VAGRYVDAVDNLKIDQLARDRYHGDLDVARDALPGFERAHSLEIVTALNRFADAVAGENGASDETKRVAQRGRDLGTLMSGGRNAGARTSAVDAD
jgi:hypothetical protein